MGRGRKPDYRYMHGVVGQYQGHDVYVIQEKDFDVDESLEYDDMLYALADRHSIHLKLIMDGHWIGNMTDHGVVEMFDVSRDYPEEKEKIEEPPVEVSEEPLPQDSIPSTSGNDIDEAIYGETLADKFLKGLSF